MSTRSHIGILNQDGTIESVYCHFDGYVRGGVGQKLLNYQLEPQVRELLARGQLRTLGSTIGSCEFYRDRGDSEEETKSEIFPDLAAWQALRGAVDHLYLFKPDECNWYHNGDEPVVDILNSEEA